ncbi:alpha/beta hydrolase [Polaribacter cellanae]|uniref:DUF676 domain-containing protein n=1 Tax=Polaribacter cellanae TaxID=2818493 RepID=A0A975CRI9_9FLAO|nr:hypothetical protein [Polaribacter cellanae]QTE24288.1 hypothetical protein J3359_08520 [Polaribacter cellanae]
MKKITLFLLLLIPLYGIAQKSKESKPINTPVLENNAFTYTQESTLTLAPLLAVDKALYKNSILYDRILGLANLREAGNIIETNPQHFKHAWQELYDARLTPTEKHLSLHDLQAIATHYQKQNIISVGIINMDFTQFTNATLQGFETDKITVAQLVARNRATSVSPYENKQVFLASPVITESIKTQANTPVTFKTDILVLNQAALPLHTVQVTYNNKTIPIVQNGTLTNANFTFSFASSGLKTLTFKATYTNGKQLISKATIHVEVTTSLHKTNAVKRIVATEPFKGYDEATDCGGNCYGEGEYEIFFGNDAKKVQRRTLQKPLIILDGFDPGDTRDIDGGSGSIRYLINNEGKEPNMQKFAAAGFDVVILNFPKYKIRTETKTIASLYGGNRDINVDIYRDGGADYIERNANVLKALIAELNGKLVNNGSTEKLKIIGPSMGGLISRVALTQMEQANQNHNADIWVSFDSPHLGANIPIGLQYFFTFMEQEQVSLLKSPAARQMLLIQNPPPITLAELAKKYGVNSLIYKWIAPELKKYPGNYSFRNTFKNLLNNLGFPNNTNRNLALINGSINGARQGTPEGEMLDYNIQVVQTILGSVGKYNIKTFATHDGGRHKIFERYKRFLFFKSTKSVYLVDNSENGSLDNSPGGTFDMKNQFEKFLGIKLPLTNSNAGIAANNLLKITDKPTQLTVKFLVPLLLNALNSSVYLNLNQGSPSFIPTKSSLAYKGTNKVWHENLSRRNLVCTNETPFDSYFAPNKNEPHITLNATKIDWILKEFNGNRQFPVPNSTTPYLSLRETLCLNKKNEVTFYLNECASPKATSWAVSPDLQIVSTTDYTAIVKPIGRKTTNTPSTVIATLSNGKKVTKQVRVLNKPTISFKDTSLRDAILAGKKPADYPNVSITNGSKITIDQTLANTISWKYTREKKYIPEDAPGTHTYYDPASLVGDFVPYTSCLRLTDSGLPTLASKSVASLVSLIDYYFQEDFYRTLPDSSGDVLPDGSAYNYDLPTIQEVSLNESSKIVFSKSGLLEVEVTAINQCGCATDTNVYKTATSTTPTTPAPQPFVTFTLTPNPVQERFVTISLDRRTKTTNPLAIENINCKIAFTKVATGATVYSKEVIFINNTQNFLVDISPLTNLTTGVYTVTVTSSYGTTSKQLIIQ